MLRAGCRVRCFVPRASSGPASYVGPNFIRPAARVGRPGGMLTGLARRRGPSVSLTISEAAPGHRSEALCPPAGVGSSLSVPPPLSTCWSGSVPPSTLPESCTSKPSSSQSRRPYCDALSARAQHTGLAARRSGWPCVAVWLGRPPSRSLDAGRATDGSQPRHPRCRTGRHPHMVALASAPAQPDQLLNLASAEVEPLRSLARSCHTLPRPSLLAPAWRSQLTRRSVRRRWSAPDLVAMERTVRSGEVVTRRAPHRWGSLGAGTRRGTHSSGGVSRDMTTGGWVPGAVPRRP